MKRFMAFRPDYYDTGGGVLDFIGDFDTLDEAKAELDKHCCGDVKHQILDIETRRVHSRNVGPHGLEREWDPPWKIDELLKCL